MRTRSWPLSTLNMFREWCAQEPWILLWLLVWVTMFMDLGSHGDSHGLEDHPEGHLRVYSLAAQGYSLVPWEKSAFQSHFPPCLLCSFSVMLIGTIWRSKLYSLCVRTIHVDKSKEKEGRITHLSPFQPVIRLYTWVGVRVNSAKYS